MLSVNFVAGRPEAQLGRKTEDVGGKLGRAKARMKVLSDTKPEGWEDELA